MNKKFTFCVLIMMLMMPNFIGVSEAQEMKKDETIRGNQELMEKSPEVGAALKTPEDEEEAEEEVDDYKILRGGKRGTRERSKALEKFIEGIELGGAVETEFVYESSEPTEEKREDFSDINLSVELAIAVKIADRLRTHILFEYEDEESLVVDEALIHYLSHNSDWHINIGKMYIPFGYYESHLISDPLSQKLGETREIAVLIGAQKSFFDVSLGAFNGDIDEAGSDNQIESYIGAAMFTLSEDAIPDLKFVGGISYISNIADSIELSKFIKDEFDTETVENYVGGFNAFLSASFRNRYFFESEFTGALDEFKENKKFGPQAWNFEFAFRPIDVFEIALQYSGSKNALSFLPETQVGIIGVYEIFEYTSIGFEYLYGEFKNKDKLISLTVQLAVEF